MDSIRDFAIDNPKVVAAIAAVSFVLYQFAKLLLATGAL